MHSFDFTSDNMQALHKALAAGLPTFQPQDLNAAEIDLKEYDSAKPFARDTRDRSLQLRISKRSITPLVVVKDPITANVRRPKLDKAVIPVGRPFSNQAKWEGILDEEKVRVRNTYKNFDPGKQEDADAVKTSTEKPLRELFKAYRQSEQYFEMKAGTKKQYDRVIRNHFLAFVPEGSRYCLGDMTANAMSKTKADQWLRAIKTGQGRFLKLNPVTCKPEKDKRERQIVLTHKPSRSMAGQARRIVSTMFNILVEQSLFDWNPVVLTERIKPPKERDRRQSREEIKAIWKACAKLPENERDYVHCLMLTAQRREQIAKMRFDWIDWSRNCVVFPGSEMKGREDATPDFIMPMSAPVREMLLARKESAEGKLVFPTKGSKDKTEGVFANYNRLAAKVDAAIMGRKVAWGKEKRDPDCFGWSFHDFRRNADMLLKDADSKITEFHLKLLIAHKLTSDAAIVSYFQSDHDAILTERARLFDLLGAEIMKCVNSH